MKYIICSSCGKRILETENYSTDAEPMCYECTEAEWQQNRAAKINADKSGPQSPQLFEVVLTGKLLPEFTIENARRVFQALVEKRIIESIDVDEALANTPYVVKKALRKEQAINLQKYLEKHGIQCFLNPEEGNDLAARSDGQDRAQSPSPNQRDDGYERPQPPPRRQNVAQRPQQPPARPAPGLRSRTAYEDNDVNSDALQRSWSQQRPQYGSVNFQDTLDRILFIKPLLRNLSEGCYFNKIVGYFLRVVVVIGLLANIGLVVMGWGYSFKYMRYFSEGIGLFFVLGIFSVLHLAIAYLLAQIGYIRSTDILNLESGRFVVLRTISIVSRMIGETTLVSIIGYALSSLPLLFMRIPFSDFLPIRQFGVWGLLSSVPVAFLAFAFFYLIAELAMILVDISDNIRKISKE